MRGRIWVQCPALNARNVVQNVEFLGGGLCVVGLIRGLPKVFTGWRFLPQCSTPYCAGSNVGATVGLLMGVKGTGPFLKLSCSRWGSKARVTKEGVESESTVYVGHLSPKSSSGMLIILTQIHVGKTHPDVDIFAPKVVMNFFVHHYLHCLNVFQMCVLRRSNRMFGKTPKIL